MTLSALARLHRDERGFLSPIILFMTIALAYMIIWILNTGQMIYDKQRTQDTADAAALVHADWGARYLNIMAMNNVASSQATVILATSTALELATLELAARSGVILAELADFTSGSDLGGPPLYLPKCMFYEPIPLVGPIIYAACAGFQAIRGIGAVRAGAYAVYVHGKYNPPGLIAKSKAIIDAMNKMNDYLVDSYPERVGSEALNLVRVNGADHLVFHPACQNGATCSRSKEGQGGDLPVDKGGIKGTVAYAEMCMAMSDGTTSFGPGLSMRAEYANRGFPNGKGPLTGGGVDGRHIRDYVNDESSMSTELPFFYVWYEAFGPGYWTSIPVKALIKQFNPKLGFFGGLLIDGAMGALKLFTGIDLGAFNPFQYPIDKPPRYEEEQTAEKNDFTRKFDNIWGQVCGAGGGIASAIGILPTPYWLKGREVFAFDPITMRKTGDQLKPYRALAVVSRSPRARLQSKKFTEKTPAFAYAESWVHNYTSFDLYTQDWRASLAPTSLADDVSTLSQTIKRSPAADSYKVLTGAFDKGGAGAWSVVNTH
ncbi:pilus assembly protein TadG-related protein [Mesorhizobium sp. KR1-2]|uniref:TadE/TadG family type IV pilus assembly protein n=1 Tax=Mesorhizobium sp. KR1-2 TaxID=3156609 RepID=UPI0032B3870F